MASIGDLSDVTISSAADAQILVHDGTDFDNVDVSGDVTITNAGVVTIAADAVTNAKLADMTQGTIKVGGGSNAPTDLDAKTSGYILIGDGTDVNSVAVSGDVTIANTGAVTIAADAVEAGMLNDNVISGQTVLNAAPAGSDEVLLSDDGVLKRVSVTNLLTGAGAVDSVQITTDSGNTGADTGTVAHTIIGATASGIATAAGGTNNDTISIDLDISGLANLTFDSIATDDCLIIDDISADTDNGENKRITMAALVDFAQDSTTGVQGLANSQLTNSSVTVGATEIALGATQTAITGLTGLDFTAADASIAASIGANTLTIGHANSHVKIAGDLQVVGTTETVSSTELLVEDKTVTLANGAETAAGGDAAGIIVDTSSTDTTRANFIWKNSGIGVAGWQFKDDGATASTPDMGVAALTLGTANPTSTIMPVGSLFYNDGTAGTEGLYLYTTS